MPASAKLVIIGPRRSTQCWKQRMGHYHRSIHYNIARSFMLPRTDCRRMWIPVCVKISIVTTLWFARRRNRSTKSGTSSATNSTESCSIIYPGMWILMITQSSGNYSYSYYFILQRLDLMFNCRRMCGVALIYGFVALQYIINISEQNDTRTP